MDFYITVYFRETKPLQPFPSQLSLPIVIDPLGNMEVPDFQVAGLLFSYVRL